MLTPSQTSTLIDKAGGTSAFGRLLGLDRANKKGWRQRVHNWRQRGLPQIVMLQHYQTIQDVMRRR